MAESEAIAITIRADDSAFQAAMHRIQLQVRSWWRRAAAQRAEWHADWYCALPWWKQWIAMVLAL